MADNDGKLATLEAQFSELWRDQRSLDSTILDLTKTIHIFSSDLREVITGVAAIEPLYTEKFANIKRDVDRLERYGETIRLLSEKLPIIREESKNDVTAAMERVMKLETHINQNESRAKGWADSAKILWAIFGSAATGAIVWIVQSIKPSGG